MDNISSILSIWPELIITGTVVILLLLAISRFKILSHPAFISLVCLVGLLLSLLAIYFSYRIFSKTMPCATFLGLTAFDNFCVFFKLVFILTTITVVLFSIPFLAKMKIPAGEYLAILLSCLLGMCFMASARNLLVMYLALEFVGVASYVLAGFLRRQRKSMEASLKYIIYGAAASGVMIFGMSYLYGLCGSLNIGDIGNVVSEKMGEVPLLFLMVNIFILAGLCYKVAAVPFHLWCPDVYEGSPTPITAFFSVGPKAAAFAMLIRFLTGVYGTGGIAPFEWQYLIAIMAIFSMGLGNLVALRQNNLKRLFAYSSIAHAGYMLLAFVIFLPENIASVMFYIFVYMIMNLGAFLVIILLENQYNILTISECSGVGWRAPLIGGIVCVFLFSLTGLPPFAGFIGKLLIFGYVIKAGYLGVFLAALGVIFSVVSLGYYAKIIEALFLKEPAVHIPKISLSPYLVGLLWILGVLTILFGLWWGWLYQFGLDCATTML